MMKSPRSFFASLALLGLPLAALPGLVSAQTTFYWDGDGSGTVDGGTGTWDTTTASWSTAADGSTYQNWDNTVSPDNAVFQNTAGTVTLGADVTVKSLTFGTTGYTLIGLNTLTFDEGVGSIDTGSGSQTISAVIAGDNGLSKSGTGSLLLSGANTYTGATTLAAGTLHLNFSAQADGFSDLISNSSALVLGGGTLHVTGKSSNSSSQTFAGTTINPGASTVIANTNAGTVTVALGAISRNAGGTVNFTLPATGNITTSSSVTNGLLGGWATVGDTDWATVSSGNIVAYSAYTANTWASGNNSNITTSATIATDSTTNSLRFATAGAQTLTLSGTNTVESGGILVTSGVGPYDTTITGGILRGANGADLVVINRNPESNSLTIASTIADNGGATGLTKSGGGGLVLSGSNTYTGATTINAGLLQAGTNVIPDGSAVIVSPDAYYHLLGNFGSDTIGSLAGGGGVDLGNSTLTVGADGTSTAFSGIISGGGQLKKTGNGMLTLSGANTYTNGTVVSQGTLAIGTNGAIAHSAIDMNVGRNDGDFGTLTIAAGGSVVNANGRVGESAGGNGTANVAGTWTNTSNLYVGQAGTGALTIHGSGTVSSTNGHIAQQSGSNGTVDVAGT